MYVKFLRNAHRPIKIERRNMDNQKEFDKSLESDNEGSAITAREALRKLGRYSAYVAPFAVLAFTQKASAITASGPAPHSAAATAARNRH